MQRQQKPAETLIDERRDVETRGNIRLSAGEGNGVQVGGPGVIDTVYVRANDEDYSVHVETNAATIVNDDFATLEEISSDLAHIDAYEDGVHRIVVIEDYPYTEFSTVTVKVHKEMRFDRIRAEWVTGNPVSF